MTAVVLEKKALGNKRALKPVAASTTSFTASWQAWQAAGKLAALTSFRGMPITLSMMVSVDPDRGVLVRSTNLENWTQTVLPDAGWSGTAPLVVNTRVLLNALRGVRGGITASAARCEQVSVTRHADRSLTVAGFGRELRMFDEPAEAADFPAWPKLRPMRMHLNTRAGVLVDAFSFAATAAGKDATLPMLTGVRIECDGNTLTFAATDRYRLAVTEEPVTFGKPFAVLVPATARKLLAGMKGMITIRLDLEDQSEGYIEFQHGHTTVLVRLLDGKFPAYRSLIPTPVATWLVDRLELIGDVLAAQAVVETGQPITISLSPGKIQVAGNVARDAEDGAAVRTWTVGLNPALLLDGLRSFTGSTVCIEGTTGLKPHILRGTRNWHEALYLIMPVRGSE